ncbi:MAG: RagB/SusD family nutrient uptake outer membrane protein, partial [Bacteroidia bacterium]|nr:RagB/SusD family nutrient uptake outer membrane protein [Bacteroidia bacterium]
MKTKINQYITTVLVVLVSLSACNELDLAPTNKFTDANYWTSTDKAEAVLSMAYSQMFGANYFFANERLTDNLYEGRGNSDEKIITSGQADAALGRFANEWKSCYEGIKTCHIFLDNVDLVPDMDPAIKERMIAEVRFIRASLFFRLANHYGDVPFFDYNITLQEANSIARTPKAEVIAFVRDELNAIVSQLPQKGTYADEDQGRITQGAVMTLLARTYLYENDWTNVASVTGKIINGDYGQYQLFPSYEGLFLPENELNEEVILDLGYTLSLRTWTEMYDAIPLSVGGRINAFAPTQELVDDYVMKNGKAIHESGSGYNEDEPYLNRDPRFDATIVYHGYQWKKANGSTSTIYIKPGSAEIAKASTLDEYAGPGQNSTATGYYIRKYFDPTAPEGMAAGLNLILMRYADVLLMYAEA